MFVTVDNATNTFFSDNPYYFCNDPKSPRTPDSQTSNKGFSIFKRRNSKGSSPRLPMPEQTRLITSANLDTAASLTLGSPRASFGFTHQSFELQPLMSPNQHQQQHQQSSAAHLQTQITAPLHQRRQRSSNSHSETFRDRLGSCNETLNHNFEHDDVFGSHTTSPSKHHHTLPSTGARRHSIGNWRQTSERHGSHKSTAGALTANDEVPQMMAPRPPVLSPNKYRGSHRRRDEDRSSSDTDSEQVGEPPRKKVKGANKRK